MPRRMQSWRVLASHSSASCWSAVARTRWSCLPTRTSSRQPRTQSTSRSPTVARRVVGGEVTVGRRPSERHREVGGRRQRV
eukprot:1541434-Prymnesium_polylepis.1